MSVDNESLKLQYHNQTRLSQILHQGEIFQSYLELQLNDFKR